MKLIYSNKFGHIYLIDESESGIPYYQVKIRRNGEKLFTTNIDTAHGYITKEAFYV